MERLRKWLSSVATVAIFIGGIGVAVCFLYGCYWIAKTTSYSFFYEDMVKKTIVQTVKPESLKDNR